MLSSNGQQSSNQMLRLVDRNRLVAQRVRVKPDEKLIYSQAAETPKLQQNFDANLLELTETDLDLNPNSNSDDLLDISNSQMSEIFQELSDNQKNPWKEEIKTTAPNFKTINGFGYYSCDSCPFLCVNVKLFLEHNEKDHHFHQSPLKSLLRTKCIGCDNIFYSLNVLRVSIFSFIAIIFTIQAVI